jgi:wyosine [tRNA(Phe)-imidazoG37] synthetase (radical SAM superfamily)
MAMNYSFIFGPVCSRRLGVSLGVDMVRTKICSLNCVYCECGATTALTLERKEYVPSDKIIAELKVYLKTEPALDYITFGGCGEPTLNTGLGRVVRFLKTEFPRYRRALLTNGTLLFLPGVRNDCGEFDLVLPNLDAVSIEAFTKVNRPHRDLDNAKVIKGLVAFRKEYKGSIWLEVFIVPGVNDTPVELQLLGEAARAINPERVQLNTLDRPGTCEWVKPAASDKLRKIVRFFSPLPVETITRQAQNQPLWDRSAVNPETIRSLVVRRPSTLEEIAGMAGLAINETSVILSALTASRSIISYSVGGQTFYKAG